MNKSYAFTGKSIKFWLDLFNFMTTTREDGIENFCKTNMALIGSGHTHIIKRISHSHHHSNKLLNE